MGFLPRLKIKSKPAAANWSCWKLMLSGFQNASKRPELRRRVLFTLAMLAVYRLGVHVPTPGIDRQALAAYFEQVKGTIFGLFNLFSGGALEQFSVFSLGIMPYISASIILQLLTVVFPYIERLSKEGEAGRRKITQYTRYGTVVLSIIRSEEHTSELQSQSNLVCRLLLEKKKTTIHGNSLNMLRPADVVLASPVAVLTPHSRPPISTTPLGRAATATSASHLAAYAPQLDT